MPRSWMSPPLTMLLCAAACAAGAESLVAAAEAAGAATAPQPGLWRFTSSMSGGPMRAQSATGEACLRADTLARGAEQAVFDAAPAPQPQGRGGNGDKRAAAPACRLEGLSRDGTRSSWTGRCTTPRGEALGPGSGTFEPARIEATQSLEMKGPFGAMTMQRRISGTRVGECP